MTLTLLATYYMWPIEMTSLFEDFKKETGTGFNILPSISCWYSENYIVPDV